MEEVFDEMESKLHAALVDVFALFKAKLDIIPPQNIEPTINYMADGILSVKETLLQLKRPNTAKVIEMYPKK